MQKKKHIEFMLLTCLKQYASDAQAFRLISDILEIIDVSKKDNRSCEEITSDIVNRCGLQVKKAAP